MQSTLLKLSEFQTWSQQRGAYYDQYNKARTKMLKSIDKISQTDVNTLSNVLNQIINDQSFKNEKITENILNKLPAVINDSGENAISKFTINESDPFKIQSIESKNAWREYFSALNEYKKIETISENKISAEEKLKSLLSLALSAQGSLNKKQGDVFEIFLQELIPYLGDKLQIFGTKELNTLIQDFARNIQSKKSFSTQGSKHEEIEFIFEEEKFKISSQGKVDVILPAPFLNADFPLKISAKNYSSLRNIHLLGGGLILGLVSQWPVSNPAKSFFLNALTVWDSPYQVLQQGRVLFGIQSLAGKGGQNELSNVLILNIRNTKNSIRAISISSLLSQVNLDNVENIFEIKFKPQLQLFNKGEERDQNEFKNRLKSLTIDTTLNKKYLLLSELAKLN